jgi:hypothetical protein
MPEGTLAQIIDVNERLIFNALNAFHNERGGSGKLIEQLLAEFGLSDPPKLAEIQGLTIKQRAELKPKLLEHISAAISLNDFAEELTGIIDRNTSKAFSTIDNVETYITSSVEGTEKTILQNNIAVAKTIRTSLAALIDPALILQQFTALLDIRDIIQASINGVNK